MDPVSAARRLDADDRRARRARWVAALAVLLVFAGWLVSVSFVAWRHDASFDDRSPFAGLDPSHGIPFSLRALAPSTLWLLVCAMLARRLGGVRASNVVWITGTALASLVTSGVAAELRYWWVVEQIPSLGCMGRTPWPVYESWASEVFRILYAVASLHWDHARQRVMSEMTRADALGLAGAAFVVAVGALRRRLRRPVERLVRPALLASLGVLVATGVRTAAQPQPSGYLRTLPVVAVLPAIAGPSCDSTSSRDVSVGDEDGALRDRLHPPETSARSTTHCVTVRYGSRSPMHELTRFFVQQRVGDMVFLRECSQDGRCDVSWRRDGEATWSPAQQPRWNGSQWSVELNEALTVRRDPGRPIAYVTARGFTVAAVWLDGRAAPAHELALIDFQYLPWRTLLRDVAPPWPYAAFALFGWIAVASRRRPRAMRVVPAGRAVYRDDAARSAQLDFEVARWNAARIEADALSRLACIALTHAPLVTTWWMHLSG